ncbi:MAG: branched-chain amino acid ABC transporter permease [Candidatus Binataceae bacterium]|nr:branched-chain amino acid ABC transporter permease [Candidatus Binataceae bacterium]
MMRKTVVPGAKAESVTGSAKKLPVGRMSLIPIVELLLLAIFAVLPLFLPAYLTMFMTRILILSLLAISFDLVWGYAGILSFGQALFFGTAGYSVALMARDLGITSIFIVLPASLLIGLATSFLIASFLLLGRNPPTVIFVALGTLTGAYAADRLARGWYYLGGQNGIPSIPQMTFGSYTFTQGPIYYYLALGIVLVVYLGCRFLVRSQFGLALAGIREQEVRIAFFGYKVQHIKTIVFSLAGACAGLAGGLYTFHEGFVWPNMLGVILSTQIVLYALFGGVGTLIGAVIGVIGIEVLSYVLSDNYQQIWPILLGALLLLVIMLRPSGLISLFVSERERIGSFGLRRRGRANPN